jgi:CHAT domain-containing protein
VDVTDLVARLDAEAGRDAAESAALAPRSPAAVMERVEGIFGTAVRTRDATVAELYAELARRELESAFGPGHPSVRETMSRFRVEEQRCQEEGICGAFEDRGVVPLVEAADLKFEDALRAALQGRFVDATRLAEAAAADGEELLRELPLERGQLDYRLGMLYLNELQEPKLASNAFRRASRTVSALSSVRTLYPDEERLRARIEIGVVRAAMAVDPARSATIASRYARSLSADSWGDNVGTDAIVSRDFIRHAAHGCAAKDQPGSHGGGPVGFVVPAGLELLRRATCSTEPLTAELDGLLQNYAQTLARPRQSYDVAGWDAAGSLLRNAVLSLAFRGRASASQAFEAVALSALNGPSRLLTVPIPAGGPSPNSRGATSCLYGELSGLALRDLRSSPGLAATTTSLWNYAAPVEKRLDVAIAAALEQVASGPLEPSIRAGLPRDSALVEFVAYQPYSLTESDAGAPWGPVRYAALVISADSATQLVPIGSSAHVVDEQIRALRKDIQNGGSPELVRRASALFDVLLAPVLRISKARRLYVVPAGAIEIVPFMALHDGRAFLVERDLQVVALVSAFDLVSKKPALAASTELKVLATPNYGSGRHHPSRGPLCPMPQRDLSSHEDTKREADAIAALWPGRIQSLSGDAAAVSALNGGPAPAVLHIASHGLLGGNAGTRPLTAASTLWQRQRSASYTSLFCSRIALAGANETNRAPSDDGWLSAFEARFLPIEGTQLVVLSACETGASAGSIGEGSFGLKSAFLAAGARSVISSLWPVETDATERYMASFYRHFVGGKDKADALYATAREFTDRKHPGFASPIVWAAFVLTGDSAPLVR